MCKEEHLVLKTKQFVLVKDVSSKSSMSKAQEKPQVQPKPSSASVRLFYCMQKLFQLFWKIKEHRIFLSKSKWLLISLCVSPSSQPDRESSTESGNILQITD